MGDLTKLMGLTTEWRAHAAALRRYGAESEACALEVCAAELEERLREWQTEPLTLETAADESGYSYSSLQQKVAAGEIRNAGDKGRPRLRRCDLPRKVPREKRSLATGEPDLAGEVLLERV
jgi:hypothetical protein